MTDKPPRHKPQPAYTAFNPTPRSPRGKHRRPGKTAHGSATIRTSLPSTSWRTSTQISWNQSQIVSAMDLTREIPKPAPIPHAGIRAGEIIATRAWYVINDYDLRSLAHHFIWEPNATIEGKIDEEIDLLDPWRMLSSMPLMGGVYAHRLITETMDDTIESADLNYPILRKREDNTWRSFWHMSGNETFIVDTFIGLAIGTVKLWGEVVEHERGYRAQYAKLVSIDYTTKLVDITKLRTKYNVPA